MKLEVTDAAAKEATEEYNSTYTKWGVFKAYVFFFLMKKIALSSEVWFIDR